MRKLTLKMTQICILDAATIEDNLQVGGNIQLSTTIPLSDRIFSHNSKRLGRNAPMKSSNCRERAVTSDGGWLRK
jgi:hypothetical protein